MIFYCKSVTSAQIFIVIPENNQQSGHQTSLQPSYIQMKRGHRRTQSATITLKSQQPQKQQNQNINTESHQIFDFLRISNNRVEDKITHVQSLNYQEQQNGQKRCLGYGPQAFNHQQNKEKDKSLMHQYYGELFPIPQEKKSAQLLSPNHIDKNCKEKGYAAKHKRNKTGEYYGMMSLAGISVYKKPQKQVINQAKKLQNLIKNVKHETDRQIQRHITKSKFGQKQKQIKKVIPFAGIKSKTQQPQKEHIKSVYKKTERFVQRQKAQTNLALLNKAKKSTKKPQKGN